MCKIVTIEPRDIHVTLDMSLVQVRHLITVLELAAPIAYDSEKNPEHAEACKYVEDVFFPILEGVDKEMKENDA